MILIASSFDLSVPPNAKKQVLHDLLLGKLSERGMLGEPTPKVGIVLDDMAGIPTPIPAFQP